MLDLPDRVSRVRLLLETLNDPYPTPQGALRSDSGPAASRYVPCETCRTRGRVKSRSGFVLCLVCDGGGWKRREPGEPEWDAYVELPVAEAVELPSMGAPRSVGPVDNDAGYGWEEARRSHDRHGSYVEVRRRLDDLGRRRPLRYRLIRVVLVDKEPREMSRHDEIELNLGLVEIALRMRSIRVPPWIMERSKASEEKNTVRALAADGYSASEIARKTGLSKEAVRRKLKRIGVVRSGLAGVPERAT